MPGKLHFMMKKIRRGSEENLSEQAAIIARSQHRTLSRAFREWLLHLTGRAGNTRDVTALMERLRHADSGGGFSRKEMNER